MAHAPTWQRAAGKNPRGGLSAAGRRSLAATGHVMRPPSKDPTNPRHCSFCHRMCGMRRAAASAATARDPASRINKALRAWNCRCA